MQKPVKKNDPIKIKTYELVNAYFDLEDKIKNYRSIKDEIEKKFNIKMVPVPEYFKGIPLDVRQNYELISNDTSSAKEEDIDKLRETMNKIDEELEQWMEKATLLEIKLAKLKKNNMEYHLIDPELRKLIKTIERLGKDEYDFEDQDEELTNEIFSIKILSDRNLEVQDSEQELSVQEIDSYFKEKLEQIPKKIKKCLEKLDQGKSWSKGSEIERNLFFVLNSMSDTEYIKNLQINDEKITNLEAEAHNLEKKANNLTSYYEKFQDKYLRDPVRKTVVKQTDLEKNIAKNSRQLDCVRNIKKYSSDSCLIKKSAFQSLLHNVSKRRDVFRMLNLMRENHFTFSELVQVNQIKEKQEFFDLKRKFQSVLKKTKKSAEDQTPITFESLFLQLESVSDKEFKKLMGEQILLIKKKVHSRESSLEQLESPKSTFQEKISRTKKIAFQEFNHVGKVMESFI